MEEVIAANPLARSSEPRKSFWKAQSLVDELAAKESSEIIEIYWYPELYGEAGRMALFEENKRLALEAAEIENKAREEY